MRRVEGAIDDPAVNVGLNRADMPADAFVYAGKSQAPTGDAVAASRVAPH